MKKNSQLIDDKKRNIFKVLFFLFGVLVGILLWEFSLFIYDLSKVPDDEKELYWIKGYKELDYYQRQDIRILLDRYVISSMAYGFFEEEMKTWDVGMLMEWSEKIAEEKKVIDFTDLHNVFWGEELYQVKEISQYNQRRYEELGVYWQDIKSLGKKNVIEVSLENKITKEDNFTVMITANGNMYFVPPKEMRIDENGDIYWIAYPLFLEKDETEERLQN